MGGAGNAAVVAVGRTFFRVAIVGYTLSGLAMFPSVILGVSKGYFEWEMDRCTCVVEQEAEAAAGSIVSSSSLTSGTTGTTAGASSSCVFGQDFAKVSIGWKEFTYDELVHTVGCPIATAAYEANPALDDDDLNLDNERSLYFFDEVYPLDGEFQKTDNPTQADESNGGAEAGGGVVAMQVVLSFFSILTYKMLKASYLSNGSHCSIGLALMTRLNLLVGVGTAAAIVSYWWLIEGRFGDEQKALTTALENILFDECWGETADDDAPGLQTFCPVRPWTFTGPGLPMMLGLFQVGLFLLMTLYMVWKAPTVEGVLDGSMDPTGVVLKPRVVEVEMVVGKALATDGDPDYDSENPLYNGAATMIRPYPLPKSAKAAKAAAVMEEDEATLAAAAAAAAAAGSDTASSDYEAKDDPEMQDDLSVMQSEYAGPADLEMIVEESEEDRTSSRYESETRYSHAPSYSDTYSDYGDRPSRQQHSSRGGHAAPIR
ncbi:unnamed protein product [Ectocarpus fasciculatus]